MNSQKLTSAYQSMDDYKEAVCGSISSKAVFIGSLGTEQAPSPLHSCLKDCNTHPHDSPYLDCTFDPTRRYDPERLDGELWTYEKNKAFLAGAIDLGRAFVLIAPPPIHSFGNLKGSCSELLWLKDNCVLDFFFRGVLLASIGHDILLNGCKEFVFVVTCNYSR